MLPLPAGREASSGVGAFVYERHRSDRTRLYQLGEQYFRAFEAHLAVQGTDLPAYVEREFEDYLKCDRLGHDFRRVRCGSTTSSTTSGAAARSSHASTTATPTASRS